MPKLKIVDGWKIRNTVDIDFCNIEDRLSMPFIPKGEIWFDRGFLKEKKIMSAVFLKKRKLMKKYGYARAKKILLSGMKKIDLKKIRLKLLSQRGAVKIYLVSGRLVRQHLDFNFVFGGHWLVYKYVPKNEIWLDDAMLTKERKYVLIHELYELNLMKKGLSYNDAHDFASAREKQARRKDGVAEYLKD
ncbi:MAG: hypothetical protein PHD72_01585 [Patescibacteria group bacterium]|nr:hypothetical protein [Patescibacteria group bacterium]